MAEAPVVISVRIARSTFHCLRAAVFSMEMRLCGLPHRISESRDGETWSEKCSHSCHREVDRQLLPNSEPRIYSACGAITISGEPPSNDHHISFHDFPITAVWPEAELTARPFWRLFLLFAHARAEHAQMRPPHRSCLSGRRQVSPVHHVPHEFSTGSSST